MANELDKPKEPHDIKDLELFVEYGHHPSFPSTNPDSILHQAIIVILESRARLAEIESIVEGLEDRIEDLEAKDQS